MHRSVRFHNPLLLKSSCHFPLYIESKLLQSHYDASVVYITPKLCYDDGFMGNLHKINHTCPC